MAMYDDKRKSLTELIPLVKKKKVHCGNCTLKAGKVDDVSFRGLLDAASLPLFFTTTPES